MVVSIPRLEKEGKFKPDFKFRVGRCTPVTINKYTTYDTGPPVKEPHKNLLTDSRRNTSKHQISIISYTWYLACEYWYVRYLECEQRAK